jgi:hypothetical protein
MPLFPSDETVQRLEEPWRVIQIDIGSSGIPCTWLDSTLVMMHHATWRWCGGGWCKCRGVWALTLHLPSALHSQPNLVACRWWGRTCRSRRSASTTSPQRSTTLSWYALTPHRVVERPLQPSLPFSLSLFVRFAHVLFTWLVLCRSVTRSLRRTLKQRWIGWARSCAPANPTPSPRPHGLHRPPMYTTSSPSPHNSSQQGTPMTLLLFMGYSLLVSRSWTLCTHLVVDQLVVGLTRSPWSFAWCVIGIVQQRTHCQVHATSAQTHLLREPVPSSLLSLHRAVSWCQY